MTQMNSSMNLKKNSQTYLSFFHMNIASLSLHFDELKALLGNLGDDFGIIGITETKLLALA